MPASGVVWRCCHQTIAVIKAPAPRADQRNVSSPLRANSTVQTMTSAPTRASGHSVAEPKGAGAGPPAGEEEPAATADDGGAVAQQAAPIPIPDTPSHQAIAPHDERGTGHDRTARAHERRDPAMLDRVVQEEPARREQREHADDQQAALADPLFPVDPWLRLAGEDLDLPWDNDSRGEGGGRGSGSGRCGSGGRPTRVSGGGRGD